VYRTQQARQVMRTQLCAGGRAILSRRTTLAERTSGTTLAERTSSILLSWRAPAATGFLLHRLIVP
jgi:hypothetical protein